MDANDGGFSPWAAAVRTGVSHGAAQMRTGLKIRLFKADTSHRLIAWTTVATVPQPHFVARIRRLRHGAIAIPMPCPERGMA